MMKILTATLMISMITSSAYADPCPSARQMWKALYKVEYNKPKIIKINEKHYKGTVYLPLDQIEDKETRKTIRVYLESDRGRKECRYTYSYWGSDHPLASLEEIYSSGTENGH